MAVKLIREIYRDSVISCDDMTITEIREDESASYSILDMIKRWDKVRGVTLTISANKDIGAQDES